MKVSLFFLFLTISAGASGQTGNHKPVAGTKFSLIPPKGFTASKSFSGFENEDAGAMIMITEVPGPFISTVKGFTAEALKSQGMTLVNKQTIDFNNSKATFIKVTQPGNGTIYQKQILVFGDSLKTVMVNGIYPEESKSLEKDIKTSLLSIAYNADQKENAEDAANFKIDVSGSSFRFTKNIAGGLGYTTDGQIPTKSADKALLIVVGSIGAVTIDDKKQFCIDQLKKMPRGESNVLKEINPITIDGMEGFEVIADGTDANNKKQLVYQVTLFKGKEGYYVISGSTIDKFDLYTDSFRKIVKTFKRK